MVGAKNLTDVLTLIRREVLLNSLQELDVPTDRSERRTQLMRSKRDELRFHAIDTLFLGDIPECHDDPLHFHAEEEWRCGDTEWE